MVKFEILHLAADFRDSASDCTKLRLGGHLVVTIIDHFFEVTLDWEKIESKESHLSQHWLPISGLKDHDLRPWVVRDVIAEHRLHTVRHLVLPLDGG